MGKHIKAQSQNIQKKLSQQRNQEIEHAKQLRERIVKGKKMAKAKKKRQEKLRTNKAKQHFEERVQQEEIAREQAKDQVRKLEEIELEYIERLKNTQKVLETVIHH